MVNSREIKYQVKGARERVPARVYFLRSATYALLVLSAFLALLVWTGADVLSRATGRTGVIQGAIVNQAGQPVANSQVFLLMAPEILANTDADGTFKLNQVPVGKQSIIVSSGKWGQEYPVTIQPRTITDAGALTVLATPPDD